MKRKAVFFLLAATLVFFMLPSAVFASEYSDMPKDWSTAALESAVTNGLLTGSKGKLMPKDSLARAEMAAIINRAFGASQKASLSGYSDIPSNAWFYDDMAKAVHMETFVGSGSRLNPKSNITREEAFTVIARAFKLSNSPEDSMDKFLDKNNVSEWAEDGINSLISAGYVSGSNGKLNPKQNISRAEFAQIMYKLLNNYIRTAGTYTQDYQGNVMVNTADVILKDLTIKGDLIIGDGVGNGDVTLDNVQVTGRTVVRGGGVNSIKIIGSQLGSVIISKVDGNVRVVTENGASVEIIYIADGKDDVIIEGQITSIEVTSNVPVKLQNAQVENITISAANAELTIGSTAVVNTITASQAAQGTTITAEEGATITNVKIEAQSATVAGEGTVLNAEIQGDNSRINTVGTKITVGENVTGTTSGGQAISGGTSGTTTSGGGVTTSPSSNNGGSSKASYTLTVTASSAEGGTVIGAGSYKNGTAVTLTATANAGYEFVNWTLNGSIIGNEATLQYTMSSGNKTLRANFIPVGSIPIATVDDLNNVRNNLEGNYVQVADIDLLDSVYNQGAGWEPIGEIIYDEYWKTIADNSFKGVFNGNGFKISNLMINRTNEDAPPVGLFGVSGEDAQLINIALENVNIKGTYDVGGLAGDNYGSITGSSVTGFIYGDNSAGGLAGYNYGSISASRSNCFVIGEGEYPENIGGLVGYNSEGNVADSYALGKVTGADYIGGLVGCSYSGTISNSYALNPGLDKVDSFGGYFGRIVGDYWETVLTNNFARSDMGEPFEDAFYEKNVDDKDGADLHYWQIDENGVLTALAEKSTYEVDATSPENMFIEGQDATFAVTIAKLLQGYSGYENVRIDVEAYGANVTFPTEWETSFSIGPDYNTTKNITIHYDEIGNYTLGLTLVDLDNDEAVLASKSITVNVAYSVETADDLNNIRNNLGANYVQVADIDLQGINWNPIGTHGEAFTGNYYGNDHKISNLTIDNLLDPTKDSYVGLFGYVDEGTLENVILENVSVKGKEYVGALVGWLDNGIIKNSHTVGTVSVSGQISAGGLVGTNQGLIEECSTVGNVYGVDFGVNGILANTGGLVGDNMSGQIIGSFSSANVSTQAGGTGSYSASGGLVGYNTSLITRSYATGSVTGAKSAVGGLVGYNVNREDSVAKINKCFAVGTVVGPTWASIGGLVGSNYNDQVVVEKSYYDKDTTTMTDVGKGIPKTTAEMKQQVTFVDWDFTETWTITEGETYPQLKWQVK